MVPSHPTIFKRWEERGNARVIQDRTSLALIIALLLHFGIQSKRNQRSMLSIQMRWLNKRLTLSTLLCMKVSTFANSLPREDQPRCCKSKNSVSYSHCASFLTLKLQVMLIVRRRIMNIYSQQISVIAASDGQQTRVTENSVRVAGLLDLVSTLTLTLKSNTVGQSIQ